MNRLRLSLVLGPLLALAAVAAGQQIEATVNVGRLPSAVVYDTVNSRLYVAVQGTNSVAVLDTNNQVVANIPVGVNPSALCWNPTSGKVYCANNILADLGTVSIISTATNSVVATVYVGEEPCALAWNSFGNKVYVADRGSATVTVIDGPTNDVLTTVYLEQGPSHIIYNPVSDKIYTASGAYREFGKVHVIDGGNDDLELVFNSGVNAVWLAHNAEDNRLFVANSGSNNIGVFNCDNNQNLGMLPGGTEPRTVLWTPNKVFWASYWNFSLRWMPGNRTSVYGTTTLSAGPARMIHNDSTQKLYCACPLASKVIVVDARDHHTLRVITEIETGGGPTPMAVCRRRNRVYVANSWDETVTVIRDVVGIEEPGEPGGPAAAARARPCPAPRGARVSFPAAGFIPDRLEIRDALGRSVHSGPAQAETRWTAAVAPGIYFYTLSGRNAEASGRLVVR